MQSNVQGVGAGVTQMNNLKARQTIVAGGANWTLKRDATDPTAEFAHAKVNWLNTGCSPIMEGRVHVCWIMGIIHPAAGSLQQSVNVMYIGFHQHRILMQAQNLTQADLDRMHVYVGAQTDLITEFAGKFLGNEPETNDQREPISAWPVGIDLPTDEPINTSAKPRIVKPEVKDGNDA